MIDWSRLDIGENALYLSEKPWDVEAFLSCWDEHGIRTACVLLTPRELSRYHPADLLKAYRDHGLKVLHYPIEDFGIPGDMGEFDAFLGRMAEALHQGSVVIHCAAGLGRTGLVAAGYLIREDIPAEKAIKEIRKLRPGSVETYEQMLFLRRYESYLS